MKRNKVTHQTKDKPKKHIAISGVVYLRYVDEEVIPNADKGDFLIHPQNDALNSTHMGEYETTGFNGYFKVDIFDGKQWCQALPNELFVNREQYFSKRERPIDTFNLCKEILVVLAGSKMLRTYREHYTLDEHAANEDVD